MCHQQPCAFLAPLQDWETVATNMTLLRLPHRKCMVKILISR